MICEPRTAIDPPGGTASIAFSNNVERTAQELLRYANSRITLNVYTRTISTTKRDANNKVMEMVIEAPAQWEPMLEGSKKGVGNSQHPRGVKLRLSLCHKTFIFLGL
jgi:hypothetical protein